MSSPECWDEHGVRVMAAPCSTCIFRPGNLMHLRPGRMADMTAQTDARDTNVVCHQTLDQPVGAFCHGSVARRPGQVVQIAQRLGYIVEVD